MRSIIIFILFSSTCVHAQLFTKNPFEGGYFEPHVEVGMRALANGEDFFLGFGAGMNDVGYDYNVGLEFGFRPIDKFVLIEDDKDIFYQYNENLYYFSLYGGKRFGFIGLGDQGDLGLYPGFQLGYLWGKYKGVRNYGKDKGYFSPELAMYYSNKNVIVSLGYTFLNTPSDDLNNMLNIRLTYTFNKNKIGK